jgi:hypothetical protein
MALAIFSIAAVLSESSSLGAAAPAPLNIFLWTKDLDLTMLLDGANAIVLETSDRTITEIFIF